MAKTQPHQAIIFDCDGTLADTMPAHYVAWNQTLSPHGINFTKERFYQLGGTPTVTIIEMLAAEANIQLNAQDLALEKEHAFHKNLHQVGPINPVVEVAKAYHGKMPLAVATGSERWSAQKILEHLEIIHLFDHLVCADDVTNPKPAPDIYLQAANLINTPPHLCLVYEDTDLGIQGATAAGMACIDVRPLCEQAQRSSP